jgi:glycosyltransferase involved in cell wall biosynthesis
MDRVRLSIITPVYNGKNFIESCLKSVIDQDCAQAEHLIIDGGSTDGTVETVDRYARRYPHIRWISEKDRGQSSAINKGIAMAQGTIIGILNCDDYYEPAVLPRVLKHFDDLPDPSFLAGNCRVLKDDGSIWYINKPARLNVADILIGGEDRQFPHNPASYFYHKSLHDKVGLYDESEHFSLDTDFILRALFVAHTQYVNEIWGNYRYLKGTKTYIANESDQLKLNRLRLRDIYLKRLPLIEQWRIKTMRCIAVQRPGLQYARKVKTLLKSILNGR